MADPEFIALQEKQTRLMVRNSVNHPSVIIWAFLNEFESGTQEGQTLCRKLVAAIRKEDDSRLVTFACSHVWNDICTALTDIQGTPCGRRGPENADPADSDSLG